MRETFNALSLCSGIGALDLGLRLAIGDRYRTIGYVEREAYAAATLVARIQDQTLDSAPLWDDLTTFEGAAYRGRVDLVASGLPCQPYSLAGARQGNADDRALWPHFVRIVHESEPSCVFLENVPPFLKQFEPVYRRLREMGFEFAPPLLHTASESGAPHIRRRVFILAAHSGRARLEIGGIAHNEKRASAQRSSASNDSNSDSDRRRREGEWSGWVLDSERQTLGHDSDRCGSGCRTCGSHWETESPVLSVVDGSPDRVDQLRAIGNAVVPQVVASAFRTLVKLYVDQKNTTK